MIGEELAAADRAVADGRATLEARRGIVKGAAQRTSSEWYKRLPVLLIKRETLYGLC